MNSSSYEMIQEKTFLGVTNIELKPGFFVPAHVVSMILVPYGLYLTFSSYLCPTTCLPSWLPLAGLATLLGTQLNLLMGIISLVAASLHVGEAALAWQLSRNVYNLNPTTVALWTLNVFFFGIFGFWPLAFPDKFYSVSDTYCQLPGAACYNI